jgi:hypothetical protein
VQCLRAKETDRRYGIITKDEMIILIGRSPGILDAMIMRMLFLVTRKK